MQTKLVSSGRGGDAQVCRRRFRTDEERWLAVQRRDRTADGLFYYSVRTTQVYCRPSCGARLPRRENVHFHLSSAAAEAAGFRPCKRCQPSGPSRPQDHASRVARACRILQESDPMPDLATLAQSVGMSQFHFHRVFKNVTGLTPKQFASGQRSRRVRESLQASTTVTRAIYEAGYQSNSRFYERSSEVLGMRPKDLRSGGAGLVIRFAVGECSLGSILVAATERGVCAILLGADPDQLARDLQDRFPKGTLVGGDEAFEQMVAQVVGFVEVPGMSLDLPMDLRGTAFQEKVWRALQEIRAGTTTTYTDIAMRIGQPKAVRAVARACAANSLAVAIPCHRVVRRDGSLSGYRWGVERKRVLLERERRLHRGSSASDAGE